MASLAINSVCLVFSLLLCLAAFAADPATDGPTDPPPRTIAPTQPYSAMPLANIHVDLAADQGPLETWRQTIGHGGINSLPLPPRVVTGLAGLRPRLIRIFIQEFFNIYPEAGRFDWSRLDPYMDALARTDAKVVAAITIKPKALYPNIDQSIWRPNDVEQWQRVIAALVKRYSIDKPIVTHWEIGNETDIGENGGCPYLIKDVADYAEYYAMTIKPILATFPGAKVGGAAVANAGSDYLPKFIELCRQRQLRLDFISWHLYSDNPDAHAGLVARYRKLLESFPGQRPEMLVTEWSKSFDRVSVEDLAFEPRRAAITAACLLAYIDAKVDWTFYYHAWDQTCYLADFRPFFQDPDIMYHHWNEAPHRFGLFGVDQEVRPQYFVYQFLGLMGDRRIGAAADQKDLRVLAGTSKGRCCLLIVNHNPERSRDRVATIHFAGLLPGTKQLRVYRIDRAMNWPPRKLELPPLESRPVDTKAQFSCQTYCPTDSVSLIVLDGR